VYAAPPEERKKRIYSTAPSKFTTIDQVTHNAAAQKNQESIARSQN
jgi:hypothetical protein